MSRRTVSAAAVLVGGLLLAGCTGPDDGSGPTASPRPAATATIGAPSPGAEAVLGDGYRFTPPAGWGFPGSAPPGTDPSTLAVDLEDDDDFPDNVTVVVSPGEITPEQVEEEGQATLADAGASDVEVRERISVAGGESAHLAATYSQDGLESAVDQFYLTNAEQTYIITFAFSTDVPREERDALTGAVLDTWRWE